MFLKMRCIINGKICMSQRYIMKTVIVLGKKHVFHHEIVAYQNTALT